MYGPIPVIPFLVKKRWLKKVLPKGIGFGLGSYEVALDAPIYNY